MKRRKKAISYDYNAKKRAKRVHSNPRRVWAVLIVKKNHLHTKEQRERANERERNFELVTVHHRVLRGGRNTPTNNREDRKHNKQWFLCMKSLNTKSTTIITKKTNSTINQPTSRIPIVLSSMCTTIHTITITTTTPLTYKRKSTTATIITLGSRTTTNDKRQATTTTASRTE